MRFYHLQPSYFRVQRKRPHKVSCLFIYTYTIHTYIFIYLLIVIPVDHDEPDYVIQTILIRLAERQKIVPLATEIV